MKKQLMNIDIDIDIENEKVIVNNISEAITSSANISCITEVHENDIPEFTTSSANMSSVIEDN